MPNDSKNIVDLSQYCTQKDDREVVTHIYNNLNKIEDYMEYEASSEGDSYNVDQV